MENVPDNALKIYSDCSQNGKLFLTECCLWITLYFMRILSRRTLINFYETKPEYQDAKSQLEAWYMEAKSANWHTPADVKEQYRSASLLKMSRIVFNICGNKYRLVVKVNYPAEVVYIRFIGTHKEYDKINAEEI